MDKLSIEEMEEAALDTSMEIFMDGLEEFHTDDDISAYCQVTLIVAAKILAGIKGLEYRREFMSDVVEDEEVIFLSKEIH
tara:strand:- start:1066 stop:1305 length:240 start_codon:yes stop_codon:yes gene_type:complete